MTAKRPTNNTVAMKLTDEEIDVLLEVANENDEKTTTQAKTCFLLGLEMNPTLELVRQLLTEEGTFGTKVRKIKPTITDEECLRWIQNVLVEAVYAEREAVAHKARRVSNIFKGNTPPQGMKIPSVEKMLKDRGEREAEKIIEEAITAAMLANGWSYDGDKDQQDWY